MTQAEMAEPIETTQAAAQGAQRQILTFRLAGDVFAIDILRIKEIIEFGQITEVPLMPGFVRGVINLRGAVVPVIDLLARFGEKPSAVSRRTCIVIIEVMIDDAARQDVGVVVDGVDEVMELSAADIESAPRFGAAIRADFIESMARVKEGFVIILSVDKVLSLEEMAQLSQDATKSSRT